MVARDAVRQAVAVFGVDEGLAVKLLDQLHDAGLAVDLAVDRCDLKNVAPNVFQLGALPVVAQHLLRDAVLAGHMLVPEGVAFAVVAHRGIAAHLCSPQQPHDRKDRAVLRHFPFDLFSGHSRSAFVMLYIKTL